MQKREDREERIVKLWGRVLCAWGLDLVLGDPLSWPHPVELMGRSAVALEEPMRRCVSDERNAGVLTAAAIVLGSTATAMALERGGRLINPGVGDLVSILLIYTAIASRDLATHAEAVRLALNREDLPGARRAVARIVGRDTDDLDESGVARAAVESVAENTVDGVISPLLYAAIGGAPAAVAFKAISTLDSTFGYKNARYLRFGWASARLDDAANYLPARLSVLLVGLAAGLRGRSWGDVMRTVRLDGRKHVSPNAGLAEAAFAGALGVRLGGPVSRDGREVAAPFIGESGRPAGSADIRNAVRLMWASSALALCFAMLLGRLLDSRRR
ncbi:MAG: adenosylcobinamide-phosphate synthase CbiB [Thermoleophilia bacterium]